MLSPAMSEPTQFSEDNLTSPTPVSTVNKIKKKKRSVDPTDALLTTINEQLQAKSSLPQRDRFTIFGEQVAIKLRSVSDNQRIMAEKLINDVLFEAELANLNRNCKLVIGTQELVKKNTVASTNLTEKIYSTCSVSELFSEFDPAD